MKNVLPPSRFLTKNFLYSAASTDGAHTPTPWCSATSLSRLQLQSYKTFLKWRNIWKRITHRERFPVRNALLEHRPRPIICTTGSAVHFYSGFFLWRHRMCFIVICGKVKHFWAYCQKYIEWIMLFVICYFVTFSLIL